VAQLPTAVADINHFATRDLKNNIYVTERTPTPDARMWRLNTTTLKWKAMPTLGRSFRDGSIALGPDGMLYAIGGATTSGCSSSTDPCDQSTAAVTRFDPTALQWTTAPSLNYPRMNGGAVRTGGKLIVVGGAFSYLERDCCYAFGEEYAP
jgi:hypothetical protein